jgi:hypothetical protein
MRRKSDHEGADRWLRIIVAIGELGLDRAHFWLRATARVKFNIE